MKKKIVNVLNNKVISMILIIICVVFFVFIGFVISREIFVYNVANKNLINYLQNELTSKASEIDRINKTPIYGGKLLNDIEFTYKDKIITNYVTYQEIVNNYGLKNNITKEQFKDYSYLLVVPEIDDCSGIINKVVIDDLSTDNLDLIISYNGSCGICAPTKEVYFIPINNSFNITNVSYNYIEENKNEYNCDDLNLEEVITDKPLIYLYPENQMEVEIKLGNIKEVTTTYPKYESSWNVIAYPNGNLIDLKTGRNLYGLYWEGKRNTYNNLTEGFIVKKEDTIKFLEEKLAILGLNEREANEFIIYWLPQLEENKYNFISFKSIEEINNYMPLEISPTPDTIIRILMEFKGLDEPIDVKEQKLETPKREGFVVVEWGGSKLD